MNAPSQLVKALVAAKKEFKAVKRDKENTFFKSKYADLEAVNEATDAALAAHGLAIMQYMECGDPAATTHRRYAVVELPEKDGTILPSFELVEATGPVWYLVTELAHESGETRTSRYPVNLGGPQDMGSAITYARRYAKMAMLDIAAEDDDGNAAAGRKATPQAAPASKPLTEGQRAQQPAGPLTVTNITGKSGKSSQGKEYTVYTIELSDGRKVKTFDGGIVDKASAAMEHKFPIAVEVKKTQYGLDLKAIGMVGEAPAPKQETMFEGGKADPNEPPPPSDDDLPF